MNDELQERGQKKLLGIFCSIAIIAVLVATLWPFDFFPPNRIRWLSGSNGIQFLHSAVVFSEAPLKVEAGASDNACSLEIVLRPASVKFFSHATILDVYATHSPTQFMLQQWRDDLMVTRHFIDAKEAAKEPEFHAQHIFQPTKVVFVTLTSGSAGTFFYVNGSQMQAVPNLTIRPSDFAGQIVMGTSAADYHPWLGEVRGLAIYWKALSPAEALRHYREWMEGGALTSSSDLEGAVARYAFTEKEGRQIHSTVASGPDLDIPATFKVPHKRLLESPGDEIIENDRYVHDVWVNIAGIVPLGFVLCAYWACTRSRKQAILYTILAGGSLSFVIEVLQAYIPQRGSGVTDIITNTTGAALGAILARPGIVQAILGRAESITAFGKPPRQD